MKRRHILLACLVIIYLLRDFGPVNLSIGTMSIFNNMDYGNITLGSLTEKEHTININWEGGKVTRDVVGAKSIIEVEIKEFNKWDLWLFVPFYKKFNPEVLAHVNKESGQYLGSVKLVDEVEITGFYGRTEIIRTLKSRYSRQIIDLIDSRSGVNASGSGLEMICQDEIQLNPFKHSYRDSLLQLLNGSPQISYYCLKPELKKWSDTIFYSNNNLNPFSFETTYFDRGKDSIIIKRFKENGMLLLEARFRTRKKPDWETYFTKGRKKEEIGYSTMGGELVSVKLFGPGGEEILSRKYIEVK